MKVGASQAVAGPWARGHPLDSMGKQMGTNGLLGTGRPDKVGLAGTRQDGPRAILGSGELSAGWGVGGGAVLQP